MNKINGKFIIEHYSRFIILLIIVGVMAKLRPVAFWTWANISTVVFQQAPFTMLMSFGMTLAIITKGIDKSMGSVLVLSSVISAGFIKNDQIVLGIFIALFVGLLCGLINGLLITKLGLFPFIATYGVDFVALGLAYVYTGGTSIYGFSNTFRLLSTGNYHGITNLALITFVIFIILHILTTRTIFGRKMYSMGFNVRATALSGNNVDSTLTIVYIINGLIAAIAGILYMARLNAADPGIGGNFTLDSIAAALIGGTSFGGGKGSITNALVGALIIVFIRNGMNIMGIETTWQQTVVGFIILFSILLEAFTKKILSMGKSKGKSL
jgi:ribose transport system permease protein